MKTQRTLIAGIGNIFLGDDAFGVEVARSMARISLPPGVRVVDFGIRGIDLAYALLGNYDRVILIDAMRRGQAPGTLSVIEPSLADAAAMETHEMTPAKVLASAKSLGANLENILLVACEPESFGTDDEPQMGLSATVAAVVDKAVSLIESLIAQDREVAHA